MLEKRWNEPLWDADGGAGGADTGEKLTLESVLADPGVRAEYDAALEAAKAAWEKEAKEAAEKEEMDPARLAQKEIAELRAQIAEKELREKVAGMAAEKKLPAGFVDFLVGADEAASQKRVEAFAAQYNADVTAAAKALMPGSTPRGGDATADPFLDGFNGK